MNTTVTGTTAQGRNHPSHLVPAQVAWLLPHGRGVAGSYESQIRSRIHRTETDPRPVVIMICGISGAGKSTLAKQITASFPNFTRLSVDTLIYEGYGLYAIDYPANRYAQYQAEAMQRLEAELISLLHARERDIALDLSFWNKEYRDEYKATVEKHGGRWVLVHLDAEKDVLWRRIGERRARRDAFSTKDAGRDGDSAFDVDEEIFEMYHSGFEKPAGEGEIGIKVL